MKTALSSGLFLLVAALSAAGPADAPIDLSGRWRFALDRLDAGRGEHWYERKLDGTARLPGSLPGEGIGDPVALDTPWTGGIVDLSYFTEPEYAPYRPPNPIKVPFWLQPSTVYVGAAWFQRDFEVPPSWSGLRLVVLLERPHWKTTLWLDGQEAGTRDSLSVAHTYDLGRAVQAGRHTLTLRVDNTLEPVIGENSHSISDHTQGNWNGVVGRIEVRATQDAWIEDLQAYPSAADRTVRVRGRVSACPGVALPARVTLRAGPGGSPSGAPMDAPVGAGGVFEAVYALGKDAPLWDEFSPALNRLSAALDNGESRETVFGLRDVASRGGRLWINGRPLFLRGTLDCAAYPLTGHPPVDVASWRRILGVIRSFGLNHVRFHSWCPPEAAFEAGDELGVYFQVEMASWPNWGTTLGDGKPVDGWLEAETTRILAAYGNHPSFAFISACNEPGGEANAAWLSAWILRHRAGDPRRLFTSASGWPELPENDYNVTPKPRIQQWGEGLASRINRLPPETLSDYGQVISAFRAPVVSHEIGQWCAYPDLDEMPRYTGYLKERNYEIFRDGLASSHLLGRARDFLAASGKLQVLCYKEEIESALRTAGMGGFQLLGLSDFPGQGTATVGVLNALWEEKGYVSPAEFRRFCSATVPLARLGRRVFTTADTLEAGIEVAHFGPAPILGARAAWSLAADDGTVVASGRLPARDIPVGPGCTLGRVSVELGRIPAPARYSLKVVLEGTEFRNDWDVWVYPEAEHRVAGPLVARAMDADVRSRLAAGGAVVLMIPPERVTPDRKTGPVALGFSSIFWNTAWTHRQAPHTLGILCDPRNAALAYFPTDPWSNWQWWYPLSHASAMILDTLPPELIPTVQVVDDWVTHRRLALVFEARVGGGRLLVTSIDLWGDGLDPVRRQLRASLLAYAASPAFEPSVTLSPEEVESLGAGPPAPTI